MPKLHELLAVESDLKVAAQAARTLAETHLVNADNFIGRERVYRPLDEEGETFQPETTVVRMTVDDVIQRLLDGSRGYIDTTVTKEVANASAFADVVVDGKVILKHLTATALLNLEQRLKELIDVLEDIPVLDSTEVWKFDEKLGVYVSSDRVTYRTVRALHNHVLAEATKEHPAQVSTYTTDDRVGEWHSTIKCGAVGYLDRRRMLDKAGKLLLAVKQARQRANDIDVDVLKVTDDIFRFITEK